MNHPTIETTIETLPVVASAENSSVTEEPYELGEGFYEVEDVF